MGRLRRRGLQSDVFFLNVDFSIQGNLATSGAYIIFVMVLSTIFRALDLRLFARIGKWKPNEFFKIDERNCSTCTQWA